MAEFPGSKQDAITAKCHTYSGLRREVYSAGPFSSGLSDRQEVGSVRHFVTP